MKKRLPIKDEFFRECEVLQLNDFNESIKATWLKLGKRFETKIDYDSLATELDIFEWNFQGIQESFKSKRASNIEFWENLRDEYQNICDLALIIITLPYSTVSIERTFSILRQIRGTERNRLSEESLEACLFMHQTLGDTSLFTWSDDLINNYSKMWHSVQESEKLPNRDSEPHLNNHSQQENSQSENSGTQIVGNGRGSETQVISNILESQNSSKSKSSRRFQAVRRKAEMPLQRDKDSGNPLKKMKLTFDVPVRDDISFESIQREETQEQGVQNDDNDMNDRSRDKSGRAEDECDDC